MSSVPSGNEATASFEHAARPPRVAGLDQREALVVEGRAPRGIGLRGSPPGPRRPPAPGSLLGLRRLALARGVASPAPGALRAAAVLRRVRAGRAQRSARQRRRATSTTAPTASVRERREPSSSTRQGGVRRVPSADRGRNGTAARRCRRPARTAVKGARAASAGGGATAGRRARVRATQPLGEVAERGPAPACQALREHDPARVEVAGRRRRLALHQLRGHVAGGPGICPAWVIEVAS